MKDLQLEDYLTKGVENIVKGAVAASLSNPKESVFMAKYAWNSRRGKKRRRDAAGLGRHVPPFLIASITSQCNLHCKGCYARATKGCYDGEEVGALSTQKWADLFTQADALGIGFILLAGGEPMMRRDVIQAAATHPDILFPIFTNGTLVDQDYLSLLDANRNLVPVLSIEGGQGATDGRRGKGVYAALQKTMAALKGLGILYGVSVTVTRANLEEVTADTFVDDLYEKGCSVIFYVEYVPVGTCGSDLAPGDVDRGFLRERLDALRTRRTAMLFVAFPGDERASGGCLAAGRGFFHINPRGGVEPCPFSPYSDTSLTEVSLAQAVESPLFKRLQQEEVLKASHTGGCVLYEQDAVVQGLLAQGSEAVEVGL